MSSSETPAGRKGHSNGFAVAVFGEVLYDCFPDGRRVLGGAPFNVAWGLRGLGAAPFFLSAVGDDADGAEILAAMRRWGMRTDGVRVDPRRATGEVVVSVEEGEPTYEIREDRAWDCIEADTCGGAGWLYHGSLALRSEHNRGVLAELARESGAKRFFDVNLRAPYYSAELLREWMRGAEWLKLNLEELGIVLDAKPQTLEEAAPLVDELRRAHGVRNVLLTAGHEGALIRGDYGDGECRPAPEPAEMVDAVGAGDSFSAMVLRDIGEGVPADRMIGRAARFAAKVCGLRGATVADAGFYRISET